MESDGSNSQRIQLSDYSERLAENVVGFQQLVDEVKEAIEGDESFSEMTVERYNQKKTYLTSRLNELSSAHNSLADQFGDLIEEMVVKCPPSLIQNQPVESSDSASQILDDVMIVEEMKDSGSETSMSTAKKPPVNDDALKMKEIKDSVSESSMSTAKKHPLPPVNDDALKVKEVDDPEVFHEKINSLEEEATRLKQKVESLTDENVELKRDIEEDVAEVRACVSKFKLGIEAMEEQLKAWKEKAVKIDERLSGVLAKKMTNQSKHGSEIKELNIKMRMYMTEISQVKAAHEQKEKNWNDVTGMLKEDLKQKSALVDELSKTISRKDEQLRSQDAMIQQLKARLNSVQFDKVQKLTDEVKLKVVELEQKCAGRTA